MTKSTATKASAKPRTARAAQTAASKDPAGRVADSGEARERTTRTRANGGEPALEREEVAEEVPADGEFAAAAVAPQVAEPPTPDAPEPLATGRTARLAGVGRWIRSNLLSCGLAIALVAAVVLLILSQLSLSNKDSLNRARDSALAAAKTYSVDLASYDYRHLDQDFGKVLSESTPTFRQSFSQSSAALKTVLTRYNASAQASVVAAGLVSATTNRAVALVFLNQTIVNTIRKGKPTTDMSRVEISLLRSGGRWLINQVSLL